MKSKRKKPARSRPVLDDPLPFTRRLPAPKGSINGNGQLTKLNQEFIWRYTSHYDETRAAREAGYPAARAHIIGRQLLHPSKPPGPAIRAAIAEIEADRMKRLNIDGESILKRMALIATADLGEIVELRVPPCRYCYGKNNEYQRTYAEMARDLERYNRGFIKLPSGRVRERQKSDPPFDEQGGDGYDKNTPPNPDCPECFGDGGQPYIYYRDTRFLSPAGRALLAGIKDTKLGRELQTHSQLIALQAFARIYERQQELQANAPQRKAPTLKLTEMSNEDLDQLIALEAELDEYDKDSDD